MALVGSTLTLAARLHARAVTAVLRADAVVGAFLVGALDEEERSAITLRSYATSPFYRESQLEPWERAWFARALPAGGRILVGACGAGREVGALLAAGFAVDAYDPSASLLDEARRRHAAARFVALTHEDVAHGGLPTGWSAYDAVLLGCASLSHVAADADRRDLVLALDQATSGPILASYWNHIPGAQRGPASTAAARLGAKVGRWRGRRVDPQLTWDAAFGFAHAFTAHELAELAAGAGRVVRIDGEPFDFPHATLVRP